MAWKTSTAMATKDWAQAAGTGDGADSGLTAVAACWAKRLPGLLVF